MGGCAPGHQGVELRIETKDLGKRDAAPIALVAAAGTTDRAKRRERRAALRFGSGFGFGSGWRVSVCRPRRAARRRTRDGGRRSRFPARRAEPAHEPLGDDPDDVSGEHAGGDSDVEEPGDRADRGVRVQGGVDLVAGHRGPEGHGGGVRVADLADQDDVRILPHEAPHPVGEVELDRFVDRGLADPGHRVLDRILERHDVDRLAVEVGQDRIEGGGLAAARRSGHQDDAFRALHHPAQLRERIGGHPQLVQGHDPAAAVEHPQHDVLAVRGGEGGHPVVDVVTGDGEGHAAVLGSPRLGDVHAAYHLEAHRDGGPVAAVKAAYLAQHSVDPVADSEESGFRFEVDVGGPSFHRVGQQHVDEADDRLAVFVGGRREAGRVALAGLDLAQDPGNGEIVAAGAFQESLDVRTAGEERNDLHLVVEQRSEVIERDHVEGVGHRDGEPPRRAVRVALQGQADGQKPPRDRLRDRRRRIGLGHRPAEVDALDPEGAADGVANDRFGDEPEPRENVREPRPRARLLGEGDPGLVLADRAGLDEQGPEVVEAGDLGGGGAGSWRGPSSRHGRASASRWSAATRSRTARMSKAGGERAARSSASR